MGEKSSDVFTDTNGNAGKDSQHDLGYGLYPERRNSTVLSLMGKIIHKNRNYSTYNMECEKNVLEVIKTNPVIKLFVQALKSSGCPINIRRHIVCEDCDSKVTGGYDSEFNQIVICQNISKARNNPAVTLTHEFTHMFDVCTNEVDYKDLNHLACTEIRAANFAHCSFMSSLMLGMSSPINIKETHQACVQMKAAQSMMVARNISYQTAMEHILKVFDKCYNDLEPLGRRLRRNSSDSHLAYSEAVSFGYCR